MLRSTSKTDELVSTSRANGRLELPSPPRNFLVGHASHMLRHPTEFLLESHRTYGDAIRLRLGPRTAIALFHPEHVYHVLVKRRENYTKQARGYQKMRRILGNGLVTSEDRKSVAVGKSG